MAQRIRPIEKRRPPSGPDCILLPPPHSSVGVPGSRRARVAARVGAGVAAGGLVLALATAHSGCEAGPTNGPVQVVAPADVVSSDVPGVEVPEPYEPTYDVSELFDLDALADPNKVEFSLDEDLLAEAGGGLWTAAFAFRSQVWHASPWDHLTVAYLPASPNPDASGLWVILHAATLDLAPILTVEAAFGRAVAETLGVPVLIVGDLPSPSVLRESEDPELAKAYPNCFERLLGGKDLFNCSETLTTAGEDLRWDLLIPMTQAYLRAMSAAPVLAQQARAMAEPLASLSEPTRFALLGAGDRGLAAWLAGALDERVAGVWVGAHDAADLDEFWTTVASAWPERAAESLQALAFLDTEFGRHWRTLHDPGVWAGRMGARPVVLARGTNDPNFPIESYLNYGASLGERTLFAYAPNFGHGFAAPPLDASWLGFVASLVAPGVERTLSLAVSRAGNDWVAELTVEGGAVEACELWWSVDAGTSPRDYRLAEWSASSFDAAEGGSALVADFAAGGESAAAYAVCRHAQESGAQTAWFSPLWVSWQK